MQKYKKIWYLWGLLGIMRIIFKNGTLPEIWQVWSLYLMPSCLLIFFLSHNPEVLNIFGTRDQSCGRQFFYGPGVGVGGWQEGFGVLNLQFEWGKWIFYNTEFSCLATGFSFFIQTFLCAFLKKFITLYF